MKREEAIALVEAMFGSSKKSHTGNSVMNSPKVQQAYSKAFGKYPPTGGVVDSFWADRLREIIDALENRCRTCDGFGTYEEKKCPDCDGLGNVAEQVSETDVVPLIKSILAQFGIKDSQGYVQATIHLDYDTELVGVSIKKKMFAYANNTTTGRCSDKV